MKRVNNSDIKIKLTDFRVLTEESVFRLRFYTTNPDFYFQKDEGDIFEGYIKLDWADLKDIGEGVLNYRLWVSDYDDDFEDYAYDKSVTGTTDYYVDSNYYTGDPQDDTSFSDKLNQMQQSIDGLSGQFTDLQSELEDIINEIERVCGESLNDLNTRLLEFEQ